MKEVRAQLRNVELDLLRVLLVKSIQVVKHIFLIFACVKCENDCEYLILLIRQILLKFASLASRELLSQGCLVTFYKSAYFAPAMLPVVLINDLIDQALEITLGY